MMTFGRLTRLTLAMVLGAAVSGCYHLEDSVTQYVDHTDKITQSAGNAKDANVAIHMVDPWPRASASRRMESSGSRAVAAHERYRDPSRQPPRVTINPPTTSSGAGGSSGGAGAPAGGAAR